MPESTATILTTILILIALMNVLSFSLFYSDKKRARNHKRRISERSLLLSSFFLGGVGAYFGMKLFRHKTKHRLFKLCVPLAALLTFSVFIFILAY